MGDGPIGALAEILRQRDAPVRMREDFPGFLAARPMGEADRDAMGRVDVERLLVYRSLVHNRMRNTIAEFLPRVVARIGSKRLTQDFAEFMHQRAARSPYLRDVPQEFVEWVTPRWLEDPAVDDYLVDLARHELLAQDVANDPAGGDLPTGEGVALEWPLRFDGAARLMSYGYAVHLLDKGTSDAPERRPIALLVYRDMKYKVRYLELTSFGAAILRRLMVEQMPVTAGLRAACSDLNTELDDDKLAIAAGLLADLADRGVMLGADKNVK